MMEGMVVSSSSFSVYAVKKRVHRVSSPRKVARDGISVAKGLIGDQLCCKPASQASGLMSFFFPPTHPFSFEGEGNGDQRWEWLNGGDHSEPWSPKTSTVCVMFYKSGEPGWYNSGERDNVSLCRDTRGLQWRLR